jgi:hypothetical protein
MKHRCLLICLCGAVLAGGCQADRSEPLKTALQSANQNLADCNRRLSSLGSDYAGLEQTLEKNLLALENLKLKSNELNEWADGVVKELGPCVWFGGPFERPLPQVLVQDGTPEDLIEKLNRRFKQTNSPQATLMKVENGTAYIRIGDEERLTQRMGTTGAANYINSILYTLVSVDTIQCVDLDFKAGDHAFPGKFCSGQATE